MLIIVLKIKYDITSEPRPRSPARDARQGLTRMFHVRLKLCLRAAPRAAGREPPKKSLFLPAADQLERVYYAVAPHPAVLVGQVQHKQTASVGVDCCGSTRQHVSTITPGSTFSRRPPPPRPLPPPHQTPHPSRHWGHPSRKHHHHGLRSRAARTSRDCVGCAANALASAFLSAAAF